MKQYKYQTISLRNEIQAIRDSESPRKNEGDEVLELEILNKWGLAGWRVTNPGNNLVAYLEKEIAGD